MLKNASRRKLFGPATVDGGGAIGVAAVVKPCPSVSLPNPKISTEDTKAHGVKLNQSYLLSLSNIEMKSCF
ncbi:MAG: hypothetical protein JW929_13860, partial [Anaerolineales bacterium]|nr:hypothetical protein [Anaerolineales bacterium]